MMNRWRRKRRVISSISPKAYSESYEQKEVKNDRNDDALKVNEEKIRHLANGDSTYKE